MSTHTPRPGAAMEGEGFYNRHGKVPAGGAALAIPCLVQAIDEIPFGGDEPIVIADYGSSQGRNSLAPMRAAIDATRSRAGAARPILVYHVDQPANDFNSLFQLLDQSPDRYSLGDPNVFACGIGRSFYESVLPANSVHIAWSAYAAMWTSRVPALIPGHIFFPRSAGEARAAFERQGAQDWETFLRLRALELRAGGRLIVSVPGANASGESVFEGIMDHANAKLSAMVAEGNISAEERRRMVLNVWPRRLEDLTASFSHGGRFDTLLLEHAETCVVPDTAWTDFERDGDVEALARKHALFFRSVFIPTLAGALDDVRSGDLTAYAAFGDRLTSGLELRLRAAPAPMHSLVQILVMAKTS